MKFNKVSTSSFTINKAGGKAFVANNKLELVALLLTSFVERTYYSTEIDQLTRLKKLVDEIADKKFIAKAAIFARNEFGMRSICHALLGELLKIVKNEQWLKYAIANVIARPDEITEITAYYLSFYNNISYKKGLPAALRKGIALALEKFDACQLAKYRSQNKTIKMVDIMNLVHPKPTKENENAFSQLIKNRLKSTDTWEAKLTKAGQKEKTKQEVDNLKKVAWHELIISKKIGYLALLRNLRNIITQAPECFNDALVLLTDSDLIKKAKIFPFRFVTALEEIAQFKGPEVRLAIDGINKALEISLSNVPRFEGRTLIALDVSGSMEGHPLTIGALFAASLLKVNNADLIIFSDDAMYFDYGALSDTLGTITNKIKSSAIMSGTNFHSVFQRAAMAYNRIIILSDMQGWMGNDTPDKSLELYKKKFNCNPNIYSIDLVGYGSLQFPEKNIYCIAGLSEKVFDFIIYCEQDKDALLHKIESIDL